MEELSDNKMPPSDMPVNPPSEPLPIPPRELPRSKLRGLRTGIALFLMLFSAYLGSIFIQGPYLPLTVLTPKWFRRIMDCAIGSWLMFTEFLLVRLMQVRVRQFGDPFHPSSTSGQHANLLLLNHRTQLDWFFSWGLGSPVQRMKIILKDSLAKVPGAGWAMQCGSFVFLRRQIATDKERIQRLIRYLWNSGSSFGLFMFPEGTDLNRVSLARSHEFARKFDLPFTAYTMHPRSTGFVYLANLFGPTRLGDIYDVTVAYPDHLPSPEINILVGQLPSEVHYHVRRIPAAELPWSDGSPEEQSERLTQWLRARWSAKEQLLKDYYAAPMEQRRFPDEIPVESSVFRPARSDSCDLQMTLLGAANTLLWFLALPGFVYLMYTSLAVRYFALLVQCGYVCLFVFAGGVSNWASYFLHDAPDAPVC